MQRQTQSDADVWMAAAEPSGFYCSTVGTQVVNKYTVKWVGTKQVSNVPLMSWSMWLIDVNCLEISSDSGDKMNEDNQSISGEVTRWWLHSLCVWVWSFLTCDFVQKKCSTQHLPCTLPHSLIPLRAAFVSCPHSKWQQDELHGVFTVQSDPPLIPGRKKTLNLLPSWLSWLVADLKFCCYFTEFSKASFSTSANESSHPQNVARELENSFALLRAVQDERLFKSEAI